MNNVHAPSFALGLLMSAIAVVACDEPADPGDTPDPSCAQTIPPPLPLDVGESHRVSGEGAACFVLGASGHYLLTIANTGPGNVADWQGVDSMVLIGLERAEDSTAALGDVMAAPAGWHGVTPGFPTSGRPHDAPSALAGADTTLSREQIQAALTTAQPGDRVWLPDRWSVDACNAPETSIQAFPAIVVAVAGSAVMLADERLPNLQDVLAPPWVERLEVVAARLDQVYLPTMRTIIASDFEAPGGAGGRFFTLLTDITSSIGTTILPNEASPRMLCPGSTELSVAVLPANDGVPVASFTGVAIHEHAHGADFWRGPAHTGVYLGTTAWGTEALAVNAQEQAARILAGQRENFRQSLTDDGLLAQWPAHRWPGINRPELQPLWGNFARPSAAYATGGLFLLFAREQMGETWPGEGTGPRLYERLAASGDWSLEGVAEVLGTTADDLYDRFVLAVALDDRIAPEVVTSLPGFRTWDNGWRREPPPDESWRALESEWLPGRPELPLLVGAGAFGMWRISAASGDVVLRLTPVPGRAPGPIRITRYR